MPVVHRVEAQQRGEQPPIGLGLGFAQQVGLALLEALLHPVQRREQRAVGFLIGSLLCGETAAIDPVVDVLVDIGIDLIDTRPQRIRIEIRGVAGQRIKGAVEHADDVRRFVADDGLLLQVPEQRHRHPAAVIGLGVGVELPVVVIAVVRLRIGAIFVTVGPTLVQHVRVHHADADQRFQTL